jgi:hypothetical protein
VLLLGSIPAGGQPTKPIPTKVTVSGKEVGVLSVSDGNKKERFVLLEVDAKTTVKVQTDQELGPFTEKRIAEQQKLFDDFTATAKKLAMKNDVEGIKKAQKEFEAASKELQQHLSYYVAEGTLKVVDGELRLVGKLRPFDYKGADKTFGKGKTVVDGEATQVMFDAGQGSKLTLAIQNDANTIVLLGGAAQEMIKVKGPLRAQGMLRLTKGGIVLAAETIVELNKK